MKKIIVAIVIAGLSLFGVAANAALDPSISTSVASFQTDFNSLMSLFYPVMMVVAGALIIFSLVKRLLKKVAS